MIADIKYFEFIGLKRLLISILKKENTSLIVPYLKSSFSVSGTIDIIFYGSLSLKSFNLQTINGKIVYTEIIYNLTDEMLLKFENLDIKKKMIFCMLYLFLLIARQKNAMV